MVHFNLAEYSYMTELFEKYTGIIIIIEQTATIKDVYLAPYRNMYGSFEVSLEIAGAVQLSHYLCIMRLRIDVHMK